MMGSLESQSCKKVRDEVVPDLFRGQVEVTDCAEGRKKLGERYRRIQSKGQREEVVLLIREVVK